MDKQIELKPCPFCGERATILKWGEIYVIGCDTEMCFGNINHFAMVFYKTEHAIKTWNRRVNNG